MRDWKYIFILCSVVNDPQLFLQMGKPVRISNTVCGSAGQYLHSVNLINKRKSVRMRTIN